MRDWQVLRIVDAAMAFTQEFPRHRGGEVWGAPAVGCEQEPKRREKIEGERGRERERGCLKEGFLPL